MPKHKMILEALQVDSFETAPRMGGRVVVTANVLAPSYPDPVNTCAYHCTWIGVTCER